jgi:hypothetical protein
MRPTRIALVGVLVALAPFLAALLRFEWLWLVTGGCLLVVAALAAYRDDGRSRPVAPTDNVTCPHCRAREAPDRETCRFCGGAL